MTRRQSDDATPSGLVDDEADAFVLVVDTGDKLAFERSDVRSRATMPDRLDDVHLFDQLEVLVSFVSSGVLHIVFPYGGQAMVSQIGRAADAARLSGQTREKFCRMFE